MACSASRAKLGTSQGSRASALRDRLAPAVVYRPDQVVRSVLQREQIAAMPPFASVSRPRRTPGSGDCSRRGSGRGDFPGRAAERGQAAREVVGGDPGDEVVHDDRPGIRVNSTVATASGSASGGSWPVSRRRRASRHATSRGQPPHRRARGTGVSDQHRARAAGALPAHHQPRHQPGRGSRTTHRRRSTWPSAPTTASCASTRTDNAWTSQDTPKASPAHPGRPRPAAARHSYATTTGGILSPPNGQVEPARLIRITCTNSYAFNLAQPDPVVRGGLPTVGVSTVRPVARLGATTHSPRPVGATRWAIPPRFPAGRRRSCPATRACSP